MMRSATAAASVLIAAALLTACGGGGQQATVPGTTTAPTGSSSGAKAAKGPTAQVTVSVKIPSRTSASVTSAAGRAELAQGRRSPKYVSPGTASMTVTTSPSGTNSSVACTSGATCTLSLAAVATDTSITVQLFDQFNNPLSQQTAAIALTAGVPSNVNLTLDGITVEPEFYNSGVAQLVVNYPVTFTGTTQFTDAEDDSIGTVGNVIDSSGNVILGGTGAPINVNYTSNDPTVSLAAPAFSAGPPYELTQTITYSGAQPATSPVVLQMFQVGGNGVFSNPMNLPVVSPLTLTTGDTTYQFIAPAAPPPGSPNYSLEFVDLTPLSTNLQVTANYGPPLSALPTTLTVTGDTCTSGGFITGLSAGPFTGVAAPVSFTISATSPTGTGGCTITLQDNAGAPGPNTLSMNLYVDNAQVIIQGKKRK